MQLSITAILPGVAPHLTIPKACLKAIYPAAIHDLTTCTFNNAQMNTLTFERFIEWINTRFAKLIFLKWHDWIENTIYVMDLNLLLVTHYEELLFYASTIAQQLVLIILVGEVVQ
jgi:hypothetical protein